MYVVKYLKSNCEPSSNSDGTVHYVQYNVHRCCRFSYAVVTNFCSTRITVQSLKEFERKLYLRMRNTNL